MKSLILVCCLTCISHVTRAQGSRERSESLKVEWKKELAVLGHPDYGHDYEQITSLLLSAQQGMCSVSNVNGTTVFLFNSERQAAESFTLPVFTNWWQLSDKSLYYKEGCSVVKTTWNSPLKESERCYQVESNWPATSPVSLLCRGALFYATYGLFCKFSSTEFPEIKHQISEQGDPKFMRQGGGYVYLFGSYTNLGARLMQYDTLGNQKWSVAPGRFAYGMYADEEGYCYMLSAESGGVGYVQKYDAEGKLVYDAKLPGQCGKNAFRFGDSLFVCGQVSSTERIDGQKLAAFCIISAKTGKVYYQQAQNLDPDPAHNEDFTQIVSDGKNVYVGGLYGGQVKTNVLVKYSTEGPTTGLNPDSYREQTRSGASFNVFPNPGGSKFTIQCKEPGYGVLKVTIRNSLGQVVQQRELPCEGKNKWELDLGKQPAGNYSVEIGSGKEMVVKKLILE